jgi:crotonobetainyl-CoA:carnitine CoA-transferase CaiB-like acyl-CoA transferase
MTAAGRDADSDDAWAASGVLPLTGLPDGPPLRPPGAAALAARRLMESFAALAAGLGASVQVDGAQLLGERAAFTGGRRAGPVSVGGACRLLPAGDGLLAVSLPRPDDPLLAGAAIGDEITGDPYDAVARWARDRPAPEVVSAAAELGLAISAVAECSYRPGVVVAADLVAAAVTCSDLPAHTPSPRPAHAPLVVDFSALWAGPLCAHLLGLAGATVITVEARNRPDGARRGNAAFYDLLHGGHQAIAIDPLDPADRALLGDLVAAADIVIEASRPRALAGWGLSAEASAAEGTTWVSITAYGRAGAGGQRIGFGDDIAAAAGLVAVDPGTGTTVFCGDALADPLSGLTAAVLALGTYAAGGGRLIDIPMAHVAAATLDGSASTAAVLAGGARQLPGVSRPAPVQEPIARRPDRPAAELGRDTERVRAFLRGAG